MTELRLVGPWRVGWKPVLARARTTARAVLVVTALVGVSGETVAQTALEDSIARRSRPDYDPNGIVFGPAGSFLLFPRLELDVEHTDNLFKVENGEVSDEILLIKPSVVMRSDWDRHALSLGVSATGALHSDNDAEDWYDYRLDLGGRLDVLDSGKLTGAAAFRRGHEDRGSPDDAAQDEPTIFHVGVLGLIGEYYVDVVSLRLEFTTERRDFRDSGPVNNDDRDRFEFELRGRAGYEWVPGSTAFIEAALNVREYDEETDDNGFMRSSDGFEVLLGNTLDLSGVTFAELSLGYLRQEFDDAALDAAEGFSFGGKLVWNPTDLITITGRLRREVRETTTTQLQGGERRGASSVLTSAFKLTADYEFLDNLILDAQAGFDFEDFQGIDREDQLLKLGFGGRYLIGRNLYAGARYAFEDRDSDIAGEGFTVNSFRVFVTTQL